MHRDMVHYCFLKKNDKSFNLQTEIKKKITNVENCEKTPTIKQFVYYFYTITKRQQKKRNKNKEVLIAPPFW